MSTARTNPWRGRKIAKKMCPLCQKEVRERLDGSLRAHFCVDGYVTPPAAETGHP